MHEDMKRPPVTEQEKEERMAVSRIDHDLLDCVQDMHEKLGLDVHVLISQGCKELPPGIKARMAMLKLREKQISGLGLTAPE